MFDLTGKVALVTGARRGIGKAIAEALAKQGAKVVVTDIDQNECQVVVDEIKGFGGESSCFKLDVSNSAEVDAVISEIVKEYGRLDILINNAGVYKSKPALEISEAEWDEMLAINLKGQFLCAQRSAKEMMKNKWGRIVNIASIASGQTGVGVAGGAHYAASKGGVLGLTETLAVELSGFGINVNAIAPGAIDTPMVSGAGLSEQSLSAMLAGVPLGRIGKPEEVASVAVLLSSDEASYMTGSTVYVDGGWLAS